MVKRRIRIFFTRQGVEKRKDRDAMESFYYSAMYDLLQDPRDIRTKITSLQILKEKILRLNRSYYNALMIDVNDSDRWQGEAPSLHQLLRTHKGQLQRTIRTIHDTDGIVQQTSQGILRVFTDYYTRKYSKIRIQEQAVADLLRCDVPKIPDEAQTTLDDPITIEELRNAIQAGKPHKAPGPDGLAHELYKTEWTTMKEELLRIMNEMYSESKIDDTQRHRIIFCLPKCPIHNT
jgi:hypothetical protein